MLGQANSEKEGTYVVTVSYGGSEAKIEVPIKIIKRSSELNVCQLFYLFLFFLSESVGQKQFCFVSSIQDGTKFRLK